jgi:hypothetical protein
VVPVSPRGEQRNGKGSLPALRVGRRVRVLRRDLDQLLADAEEPSRVDERTVSDAPDTHEGWRDAEQFWGGG